MAVDPSRVDELNPKRLQSLPTLREAIIKHDAVEVKRLLDEGINFNGKDEQGYTPMHWAAIYGFLDIVKILWEKGANIRALGGKGDTAFFDPLKPADNPPQRDTPLHNAAWNGHTDVIQFFLSCGMGVDVKTLGGHTPLHWAASGGHLAAVKVLVRHGAQVDASDKQGNTAQTLAAQHNHNAICTYLASVPVKDALYSAVIRDNHSDLDHLIAPDVNINAVMEDGRILLHIAAVSGNIDTLQKLLDKGAQTNAADANGTTALHWAATNGHKQIVALLLKENADIHAKTHSGSTALHSAALGNHVDVIELLINKGADVNVQDNNGSTPFVWAKHIDSQVCLIKLGANVENLTENLTKRLWLELQNAASTRYIEVIKHLGKYSSINENNGITLLQLAAKANQVVTMEYLNVEHNINLDSVNLFGQTALHIAVFSQSKEAIEYLLQHGADINAKGNLGRTALHWAAEKGYKEIFDILLDKKADPAIQDDQGATAAQLLVTVKPSTIVNEVSSQRLQSLLALRKAIIKHDAVEVKRLLDEGINLKGEDEQGYTPMHWAAISGCLDIVKILWEKGANIQTPGSKGDTPLHNAALNGYTDVIEFFLSCGMDVDVKTLGGHTPLHWAASGGHLAAVKVLVRAGAQVGSRDKAGNTAQTLAAQHNHNAICTYLASGPIKDALYSAVIMNKHSDIDHLVTLGADINAVMEDGRIPLHIAAVSGKIDTLQKLLDKGAQTNAGDANGTTALHWAATHGHKQIVVSLLEYHADLHAKTNSGSTALHLAALGNHVDVIGLLIDKGADVNVQDNNGSTPFVWAKHINSQVCLIKLGANAKNLAENLTKRLWLELYDAASQGNIEVIKRLVKYSPVTEENGIALLHSAARANQVATLEYLKSNHSLNLGGRNLSGQTALHIAVLSQSKEAIECLLQHGVDTNATENMGCAALHLAALGNHVDVIELLIDKGADVNVQDNNGSTPFVWAKHINSQVCLIKLGANVENLAENLTKRLWLELQDAASQGNIEVIKRLVKYSPVTEENGIALLHSAARANQVATLEYLKSKHSLNLDGRNLSGQTALHIAVLSQSKEAIECLLQHGADINATENLGRTALHWAARKGYKEIYTLLLDKKADPAIQDVQSNTAEQLLVTVKPPTSLSQNSSGYFGVPERESPSTFNSTQRQMCALTQAVLLFGVAAIAVVYFAWWIHTILEFAGAGKGNANIKRYNRL